MPPADASCTLKPVARVRSPYREKFGVPRQSGLVEAACGWLEMLPPWDDPAAFEGIEGFDHLWVIFGFHACGGEWRLRVRPPRLGGNREVGVFASRSPFRPNNLGLSLLRFEGLERDAAGLRLRVSGLDLVDDTPVYDIKPYLPYADAVAGARGGFAAEPPAPRLKVRFAPAARRVLETLDAEAAAALERLAVQTLALDPRPAYRRGREDGRRYGMRLLDWDLRWEVHGDELVIEVLVPAA